ncbi:MAG: hypothetical protein LBQ20_07485 [Rhodanobacter sp.]|nr:hypothetical protein [Rhodanobacter sp.]
MAEELNKFIAAFVRREQRERYLFLLGSTKRRSDGLWGLLHDGRHLDRTKLIQIPNAINQEALVIEQLRKLRVKELGYVLAVHGELDGQMVELSTFLEQSGDDAAIFFPQANAGYYKNHEGECYVLSAAA